MAVSNASVTVQVAAVALATAGENPCEKLKECNEDDRKRLKEDEDLKGSKPGKKRKTATDLAEGRDRVSAKGVTSRVGHRNTITNGVFTAVGKAASHMKACSQKLAQRFDNDFKEGLSKKDVDDKISNMDDCAGGFDYPTTSKQNPKQSHTEARLIETIMAQTPRGGTMGTLIIKIDWAGEKLNDKDEWEETHEDVPCKHCEKVICAAQKCGLVVEICSKAGKPEKPECDEDGQFKEKEEELL